MASISQEWELDSIFSKMNNYEDFGVFLNKLENEINNLCTSLDNLKSPKNVLPTDLFVLFEELQNINGNLGVADSFIVCLQTGEKEYLIDNFKTHISKLLSTYFTASSFIDYYIAQIPYEKWKTIITDGIIKPISFALEKRRTSAISISSPAILKSVNAFSPNGFYSWEEFHSKLLNKVKNETMKNFRKGNDNTKVQYELLEENKPLFASILNNISGFRLKLYDLLEKKTFLSEALFDFNNMSENTLWKMWEIIDINKEHLQKYFKIKASYLRKERCSWTELNSPMTINDKKVEYEKISETIIDSYSSLSFESRKFIYPIFNDNWIKIENDPNKNRNAFCLNFAKINESRIYINSSNDINLITTLAHEIGHAYHYHTLHKKPILSQNYSLSIAETVSSFSELIVLENFINKQKLNKEEEISYLLSILENNVVFLLDIYSRFLFEYEVYKIREKEILHPGKLDEIMNISQRKAFGDILNSPNSTIWCSNSHFYKTNVPFYNFPYAFGCIFSNFLFKEFKENNSSFANNFDKLLVDSGNMSVEDLVFKYFNFHLHENDFWQIAINKIIQDIKKVEGLMEL